MRILIKGGVWKNTEDEILKAAVMKYGKNQWARVASLLNRKSAGQCKARWYEWLDPSIKKTEWSREEEEKLLHLAKLMPNQWRTIAPIVGRTAGQCMEHYEKLLDQAQEADGAAIEGTDDPRRLRPGEIDPAPENKPARPDPIDMDEDELEMLSEARARLANTQGKKAKRKMRERQMEESRRLSMLQKRRELKAAGIESKLNFGGKKRKFIDYAREIPFQKLPPAGFYDVGEERSESERIKQRIDPSKQALELNEMENRNERDEEKREEKKDKKRLKKLFKANAPAAVAAINALNDPVAFRKRTSLSLPAPQVSDGELEEIVKMGSTLMPPPEGGGVGSRVTQTLIGDYSSAYRPSPTPQRTPVQEDVIMQEARNLRTLRDMTPLNGEELPELYEGTGWGSMQPRDSRLTTPNSVLGTPRFGGAGGMTPSVSGTPMSVAGSSVTTSSTPLRDQFGLNDFTDSGFNDDRSIASSSRADRERDRENRSRIASQLSSLPEPEYEYDLSIPEIEQDEDVGKNYVEDAAELAERQSRLRKEEEEAELARRSSVIRRGLPRPFSVNKASLEKPIGFSSNLLKEASVKINEEMVQLLAHDEYKFPVSRKGSKAPLSRPIPVEIEKIEDNELQIARELIENEMEAVKKEKGEKSHVAFAHEWEDLKKSEMFIPTRGPDGSFGTPANKQETLSALKAQFDVLRSRLNKDASKANKLEQKIKLTQQGYIIRSEKVWQHLMSSFNQLDNAMIEKNSFDMLAASEERVLPHRIHSLVQMKEEADRVANDLQQQYAELMKAR